MDDQIATGAAALMAIRVVLDHHVPQEKILFLSLISSCTGLQNISNAFPSVKIVTAAIEKGTVSNRFVPGGFGSFSDRYFGTKE
jgi:uridine kinase